MADQERVDLGGRIRWLREDRGLAQVEVATEAGMDQAKLSSIERGKCYVSGVELADIAAVLSVSALDLIDPLPLRLVPRLSTGQPADLPGDAQR